ncbi:hypothetical protein ANN_27136 [Periplaneta americana]|uniref:Uncharacterized protein n=1 Tax=Periplaneta americana TaxID=6978 RepID=A0ABQ8RXE6_PERAM|nr:hypothetical protein ANN_27136 [Periplaneta americana]
MDGNGKNIGLAVPLQSLNRIRELRSQGCRVIYLDETWYDTHDVVKKGWNDVKIENKYINHDTDNTLERFVIHVEDSDDDDDDDE